MHLQPFEVVANSFAILVLVVIVVIHLYGRRRYESEEDPSERVHHD